MLWWAIALVVVFLSTVAAGLVADKRGADGAMGLAAGLLLGPLGVAVAFVMPLTAYGEALRRAQIADALIANGTHRQCPACKEPVRKSAIVCRYCGRDLPAK